VHTAVQLSNLLTRKNLHVVQGASCPMQFVESVYSFLREILQVVNATTDITAAIET
jgi:hypothetical protein